MSSVRLPRRSLFRVVSGRAELLVGLLVATILEILPAHAAEQRDGAALSDAPPADLAALGVDPEAVRHFTPEQLKELLTPELLAKLGLNPEFLALLDSDFEKAIKKLEVAFREKLQAAAGGGKLAAVDGEVVHAATDADGDHSGGLSAELTPLLILGGIAVAGGALYLALDGDDDGDAEIAEQPPVAANDSFTTNEDSAVTINVRNNDTDANGDALTVTHINGTAITAQGVAVTGGVVTLVNGSLVFTPTANYNGAPSFTYTVSDGKGGTSTATVSGTVTPVNDAPVNTVPGAAIGTNQGVAVAVSGLSVADVDGAGNFTVTLNVANGALIAGAVNGGATIAGSGTGTVTLTGSLAQVNASLGAISFNGGASFSGSTTLTMTTSDGTATDTDSFGINVTRVSSGVVQDGYVAGATVFIDVNGNGQLDTGEPSAVTGPNGAFSIVSNAVGSIVALGGTNTDTGLPNTIPLKAPLGSTVINPVTTLVAAIVESGVSVEAAKATVAAALGIPASVDITSFDFLAPAATPEQAQVALDIQKTATQIVTLLNNVAEAAGATGTTGDALKAAVLQSVVESVKAGAPVDLTSVATVQTILAAVPNLPPAVAQQATTTVVAINQAIESATSAGGIAETVVQLEQPGADLPPVTVKDTVAVAAGEASKSFNLLSNDFDPEGGVLRVVAINGQTVNPNVATVYEVPGGLVQLNPSNGAITFYPSAGFSGTSSFTYTVADAGGKTQNGSVEITVGAANDAPEARDDNFVTDIHLPITIPVTGNDSDPNGDPLTVTLVDGQAVSATQAVAVAGGTVILNAEGNLVFTPADGFVGAPSFTYTVSDPSGAASTATVTGQVQLSGSEISIAPAQLDGVAANAATLVAAGLEQVSVTGGVASLTAQQALQLEGANLDVVDAVDLTLNVSQADVAQFAIDPSALTYLDVDHLDLVDNSATLSDAQASALVDAGVDFVDGDSIALAAANGTHLSTSLKDLQSLHVDAVLVGAAGLTVDVGGSLESLSAESLPVFTDTGDVTLNIEGGAVDASFDVSSIAAALARAGVDHISVPDGSLTLTDAQAAAFAAAGVTVADAVDLTLAVSQQGVAGIALDPSMLSANGVDTIDVIGDQVTISDAQASALISAGVEFADDDSVTMSAAAGTHLSTSLKDLQSLHVDAVLISGDGLTVDLGGSLASLDAEALPVFEGTGEVTLNLDGSAIDPTLDLAPIAEALAAAGVDHLSAIGASLTLTDEQAAAFLAAGIDVLGGTDFTLASSAVELDTVLADTAMLAGFGVDHIDLTDNSIVLTEAQAASMVSAGVDFVDSDTVELSAAGTHLSTSLKDLQSLHVDAVLVSGGELSIDAGGSLDSLQVDHLPSFEATGDPDITLNVDAGALDPSVDLDDLASAFQTAGIDHIGVLGNGALSLSGAQAIALGDHGIGFDAGADVTVNLSGGAELSSLVPMIGDLNVDHIDMAGNAALISDADAVALVDAGVDFATGDTVTVEAQGTQLSSTLKGLHDLHVDAIRVETGVSALHLDAGDLSGISATDLPQFDIDQSDASLDVTLRVDPAALGEVERLAAALRAAGIDHFAVDQPIANYDAATQAQMQAITTASGIDFVYEEAPTSTFSTMMLADTGDVPSDSSLYRELLTSFESHDDLGAGGEFVLMDGTAHSLFEAGMLRAYTADSLVVDATGGDDLILTSLRDIADMGVDHVLLPELHGAPVYVEIGAMLPGSELDEVRHLFDALEDRAAPGSLFEGSEKIALVVDSDVAHALSQVEGALDKLATLGFTELDVLLTNGAPAPFESGTTMEVKLIGQDDDLYRHLHHDR